MRFIRIRPVSLSFLYYLGSHLLFKIIKRRSAEITRISAQFFLYSQKTIVFGNPVRS